jgi:hypothetical protein
MIVVFYRSNNQPPSYAVYAALTQFAPEPTARQRPAGHACHDISSLAPREANQNFAGILSPLSASGQQ